jgi:hypothetical protein
MLRQAGALKAKTSTAMSSKLGKTLGNHPVSAPF